MFLTNVTEEIVFKRLDDMLKGRGDLCPCEQCRMDVAALALNHLQPRYVVTERGAVFSKLSGLDIQISADVIRELTRALAKVAANPRHDVSRNNT